MNGQTWNLRYLLVEFNKGIPFKCGHNFCRSSFHVNSTPCVVQRCNEKLNGCLLNESYGGSPIPLEEEIGLTSLRGRRTKGREGGVECEHEARSLGFRSLRDPNDRASRSHSTPTSLPFVGRPRRLRFNSSFLKSVKIASLLCCLFVILFYNHLCLIYISMTTPFNSA